MDTKAIEARARRLAEQAKPGIVKRDGKIYTLEFDQREWVYRVYEDGFLLVSFNTKRLATAKKYLEEYMT